MRVNLGCGQTPTPGWINIDNSPTVRLARTPFAKLIPSKNGFVRAVKKHDIRYGNALAIPVRDASVEVLYSSHMLEHLDRDEASEFLAEAKRVLKPGGVIRIVVPDLGKLVALYSETHDANAFVAGLNMQTSKPKTPLSKLRHTFVSGFRDEHFWMYDRDSLLNLLNKHDFKDAVSLNAGQTTISDPGELNLREREDESLYVEAVR